MPHLSSLAESLPTTRRAVARAPAGEPTPFSAPFGEHPGRFVRAEPEASRAQARPPRAAAPAVVLAVDDERAVREMVCRLLTRRGHEVVVAASGEEALRRFASHPRPVRMLLTDVVMPGITGRDLAARIRELEPGLPVVYMSGGPAGIIEPGAGLPPGSAFLPKPFQAQRLFAAVEQALAWERRDGRVTARH